MQQVTETTVQQLRETLGEGWDAGEGIEKLAARVREVFDQATRHRSFTIARTETTAAANMAQIAVMDRAGVQYKQWLTGRDARVCPLCAPLDGKVVRIDEEFEPGVFAPPRHPGCRCTTLAAPGPADEVKLETGDWQTDPDDPQVWFGNIEGVPKSEEDIRRALWLAEETGADFRGIAIKSSSYHTAASTRGFVLADGRRAIYLQGIDVEAEAKHEAEQLRLLYDRLGVDRSTDLAADRDQFIKRTLLHEWGHLKTFEVTGNYLRDGFDWRRFGRYRKLTGTPPDFRVFGEWIAEDIRLMLDPESAYPHGWFFEDDLRDPDRVKARHAALRRAIKP